MNTKQLLETYNKFIDVPIYRVVSGRSFKNVLKNGIEPGNDPYKEVNDRIKQLARIINKLEEKGFVMKFNWGAIDVTGSYAIETTLLDINEGYIDFSPKEGDVGYYLKLKGGALVSSILNITNKLIEENPKLSSKDLNLVKFLNKWAKSMVCKNKAIYLLGSSKYLETALILPRIPNKNRNKRKKRKHIKSFFGSFAQFKKLFVKNPKEYLKMLEEGRFYLRARNKIPASEIKVLR